MKRLLKKVRSLLIVFWAIPNFAHSAPPSVEEVLRQERPLTWPSSFDVSMDQSILSNRKLGERFSDALSEAPSLLLEISEEDLFGDRGLYRDVAAGEPIPEVPTLASYWVEGQKHFDIRCGIRPQGAGSLSQSPKRNFRLRFSKKFGKGSLSYALFSEKIEKFENLLIRNPTHDSWTVRWPGWRQNPRYVNDRWALDTTRELGYLAPRQKWVHVYLNRIYWGLYALSERPDEHFASLQQGKKLSELNIFNAEELRHGDQINRDEAKTFLTQEFDHTPESFQKLSEFLELNAFADHLICQAYQGKSDWPQRNYFLVSDRSSSPRFIFGPWDSEIGFYEKPQGARVDAQNALAHSPFSSPNFRHDTHGPGFWYRHLKKSSEFRLLLADRLHHLIGEGGVLSPERASRRYRELLDEVSPLLLPEALRWGDSQRKKAYVPYGKEWQALTGSASWLYTKFFPLRPTILKQHFKSEGIWPELEPPSISERVNRKGVKKFYLKNQNRRGIIVYTVDGSDPRTQFTGQPSGKAKAFREPLSLSRGTQLKARVLSHQKWSPLLAFPIL